jgi:hypothetical protein
VLREKVLLIPRWVLCSFCVIFLVGFHDMIARCAKRKQRKAKRRSHTRCCRKRLRVSSTCTKNTNETVE